MIAKLIVWGETREIALARMRAALGEFEVAGPDTNVQFLARLVQCAAFADADLDTGLIERHRAELFSPPRPPREEALVLAALAQLLWFESEARARAARSHDP